MANIRSHRYLNKALVRQEIVVMSCDITTLDETTSRKIRINILGMATNKHYRN